MEDNYTRFKELMSRTDKLNIVLGFNESYHISSITFLASQEGCVAVTTYDDHSVKAIEVRQGISIQQHLEYELINLNYLYIAYKVDIINGKRDVLYNKVKVPMSLSEIEEKLKIVPGCLDIKD